MDKPLRMKFCDGIADPQHELRDGAVAGRHVARLQQLHGKILRPLVLAIGEEARIRRRLQSGQQLRLALEARPAAVVIPYQHLHRGRRAERRMLRTVHLAAAAAADVGGEPPIAEHHAGRESWNRRNGRLRGAHGLDRVGGVTHWRRLPGS